MKEMIVLRRVRLSPGYLLRHIRAPVFVVTWLDRPRHYHPITGTAADGNVRVRNEANTDPLPEIAGFLVKMGAKRVPPAYL